MNVGVAPRGTASGHFGLPARGQVLGRMGSSRDGDLPAEFRAVGQEAQSAVPLHHPGGHGRCTTPPPGKDDLRIVKGGHTTPAARRTATATSAPDQMPGRGIPGRQAASVMLCLRAASFSTGPATWPLAVAGEPGTVTRATASPPRQRRSYWFHRDCRMSPPAARRQNGGAGRIRPRGRRAGADIAFLPPPACLRSLVARQAPPVVEAGRDGDRGLGDVGARGLQPPHVGDRG